MYLYTRQTKTSNANVIIAEFGDLIKSVVVAEGDSIVTDRELTFEQTNKLKTLWNNDDFTIDIVD